MASDLYFLSAEIYPFEGLRVARKNAREVAIRARCFGTADGHTCANFLRIAVAEMASPVQIEFQESHIKRFISLARNLLRPYDPSLWRHRKDLLYGGGEVTTKLLREINSGLSVVPLIYSVRFSTWSEGAI